VGRGTRAWKKEERRKREVYQVNMWTWGEGWREILGSSLALLPLFSLTTLLRNLPTSHSLSYLKLETGISRSFSLCVPGICTYAKRRGGQGHQNIACVCVRALSLALCLPLPFLFRGGG
jgi:hypothetical protein